jgi:enoyl-CoA hydratase
MPYTTLLFDRDADGIATVTVNRPDKLNALNAQVIADLAQLAEDVAQDPATRALIVTGAGPKAFVAGADIGELASLDGPAGRAVAARGQAAFRALERLRVPVIAAVNGFALGGGCELAMACHIRLAAPHAKFGQPEVKLGLIPGFGGTVRLPRLVGRGRATELLLTARMVTAEEAERIGLVNAVVPAEELLGAARAMAATILQMSPVATALCLEAVDATIDATVDDGLALEADGFARACDSDDKREGAAAFLAKRAPVFSGR